MLMMRETTAPTSPARTPVDGAVGRRDGRCLILLEQVSRDDAASNDPHAAKAVARADDGKRREDADEESPQQGWLSLRS